MPASVYINGSRLRQRLLELRLSDREFCRETGLGQSVVRSMLLRDEANGTTPIADVARCLNTTGLTAGELLDPPAPSDPADTPEDDIQVLAQVLQNDTRLHLHDRLAIALDWTLDRLQDASRGLDARLRPLGLRIHENGMGMTIRAADNRHEEATRRLDQYRDADEGIHQGMARVLYAAYTGALSGQETKSDHMVHLGALKNRDTIEVGSGKDSRYRLTPNAAYAFDVPPEPSGPARGTRTGPAR